MLKEDLYPLFPLAQTLETWDGWQYHDPENGEGFVVVFRLRYCDEPSKVIHLKGLQEKASYQFTDPLGGRQFAATGEHVSRDGCTDYTLIRKGNDVVHIDPPGKYGPLYQRDKYRENKVQWKTVERFVADQQIAW